MLNTFSHSQKANKTMKTMQITGTFLDEISYDIPSQNWGKDDWSRDFKAMKAIGIKRVIMIRCGLDRWITYPSQVLQKERNAFIPSVDLVRMFLELADIYDMEFFFGTYDSREYWGSGQQQKEMDLNRRVVDEAWKLYGHSPAFKGWYLTHEVGRNIHGIVDTYASLGKHCKSISSGLPVLISPFIEGVKGVSVESSSVRKEGGVSPDQHEREWNEIMHGIAGAVDIVAFQDGHVDFSELSDFLIINKALADKHGLLCWTNSETFDRDMPIKFLPIKWEKLRFKLEAAQKAGYDNAITFEFSHFMSPNSCYPAAHGLYKLYCEYLGIKCNPNPLEKK
jgi:hypothetical protein